MTVTATGSFSGPFFPNGTTTAFPFAFVALSASGVSVIQRSALGVETTLTGYTITLNNDGTGTVNFASPPATSLDPIFIYSDPGFEQQTSFANQGSFSPTALNEALDEAAVRSIYLKDRLERSIQARIGETLGPLPDAATRANQALIFDGQGNPGVGVPLAKGDPGGNTMAIGPFTSAATLSIPTGTDMVRTSGYNVNGKGDAFYVADTGVNSAYVTANPRSSFISSNGRGFRLHEGQYIKPTMFGAVGIDAFTYAGDGNPLATYTDDADALDAFSDFCQQRYVIADMGGKAYAVSRGITLGGSDPLEVPFDTKECALYIGGFWLVAMNAIPVLLTLNVIRQTHFAGRIGLVGTGGFTFANRTCDVAIRIEGFSQMLSFTGIFAQGFRYAGGIVNGNIAGYNDFANDFGLCFFIACGPGITANGWGLSATLSSHTETGGADNPNQRSTFTPSAMPPTYVDSYMTWGVTPAYIRNLTTNELHYIMAVDRVGGTVSVAPWIPVNQSAFTFEYVWGGGLCIEGGDAGTQGGGIIIPSQCSMGVNVNALYPPRFRQVVAQSNIIGINPAGYNNSSIGGGVNSHYFEGNMWNVAWAASTSRDAAFFSIDDAQGDAPLSKIARISYRTSAAGNGTFNRSNQLLHGLRFNRNGRMLEPINERGDGNVGVFFDCPDRNQYVRGDNPIIFVNNNADTVAAQYLYGFGYQTVRVIGSGNSAQPAAVTIRSAGTPAPRFNGGTSADLVLSGFSKSAIILIEKDQSDLATTADNFIVTVISGQLLSASVTYDPPSIAAAGTTTTTVTVAGAVLGDRFVASFSNSLGGLMVSAYVSAANTVTVVFFNPTAGVVDLASGTLKVSKVA